ncbi:SsrA-binding protein SmpB [Candidatus Daviesbacteria bacterium]|nr:SsrA-binding protein SmpB [Candidatus Daviesbacteria bacterium]
MRIVNRKARYKYFILDTFEAGVVLNGGEVKSIRQGRVDLSNSFAKILNGEVFLINAYINPYQGSDPGVDPKRSRKLLMHRSEIDSLIGKLSSKSMSLIPINIYSKRNMFKVQLGLGKPKSKFDKRRDILKKDEQRRLEQELKGIKDNNGRVI